MREMFSLGFRRSIETGNDVILVSIIGDFGSAPRGAGAHMLVNHSRLRNLVWHHWRWRCRVSVREIGCLKHYKRGRSLIKAFSLDQNHVDSKTANSFVAAMI